VTTPDDRLALVTKAITDFNWANFGLDEVAEIAPEHADYAEALATVVIERMDRGNRGPRGRLDRIAEAHSKWVDKHGGTDGMCGECNWRWPCPTYVWATDAERDPLACWNPSDDDPKEA
jgi:hypothetical protein